MSGKPDLRFTKVVPMGGAEQLRQGDLTIRSRVDNSSYDKDDNSFVKGFSGRTSRNKVMPMNVVQNQSL
jgi:hypothetical protein